MSETVHYKGIATKIEPKDGQSLIDVAKNIFKERGMEIPHYYNDDETINALCEIMYQEFYYNKKSDTLYKIDNNDIDIEGEIIEAKEISPGKIEYELQYYNGGAGFEECLNEAFEKLENTSINSITINVDEISPIDSVKRVELVDNTGRAYVSIDSNNKVSLSLQDNGTTLKIFIQNGTKKVSV